MFCTKCGMEILEENYFCGDCGKKLKHENSLEMQPEKIVVSDSISNKGDYFAPDISHYKDKLDQNKTETASSVSTGRKNKKIGGFLFLLACGFIIASFSYMIEIYDTIKVINSGDFTLFKVGLKNLIYFNIASSLLLLALLFILMFIFYRKKRCFPKYMVIYFILNISTAIIILMSIDKLGLSNLMESKDLQDMYSSLFKSILAAIIWIPYLFISKRAKGTFVN